MRALLLSFVLLLSFAVPAEAGARVQTRTQAYGTAYRQKIDIYALPKKGTKARPAILLIHGGFWWGGNRSDWKATATDLAKRGYVVLAAGYRLSTQEAWPAQRDDVEAALAWVHRNSKKMSVNPKRIIVMGSSAGGHLASMLGTYGTGGKGVRAVVALSPVNSPMTGYMDGGEMGAPFLTRKLRKSVVDLLGCEPDPDMEDPECMPRVEDATPETFASRGDAPMLLIHSKKDFVTSEHSAKLRQELTRVGVQVTLWNIPGDMHGGTLVKENRKVYAGVLKWIARVAK